MRPDGGGDGEGALTISLFTIEDKEVELTPLSASSPRLYSVAKPKLWSPETPNCYKLVIGNGREYVSGVVGFRTSEIVNGRYELNGRKVKLHGANRHETDPLYGHYVPRERHEQDIRMLKEANCNIVRNSHYPQDDYWYYLCNVYGIALMDEANMECHGYWEGGDDPQFTAAMVWRNVNMIERNKNHPSILFWSHGNESGKGRNFRSMRETVKARDTSRPTHAVDNWDEADMEASMYPSVEWLKGKADYAAAKKPYYISEYAHNMCNAMGNLKDYQDVVESSDVIIGGTIWDWVDQGLYKKVKVGGQGQEVETMILAYGGDFGDRPNDGTFVMNGCVLSDRTPEPGYYEVKHVFRPVAVSLETDGRSARIVNKQFFRGLDVFAASWTVLTNGYAKAHGTLDLDPVGPQEGKSVPLPASALDEQGRGNRVSVRYAFACRSDDGVLGKGFVIAEDQLDLSDGREPVLRAGDVVATFDPKNGALVSYWVKGRECLLKPMVLDAFRAPSSNEGGDAWKWQQHGWENLVTKTARLGDVRRNRFGQSLTIEQDVTGAGRHRRAEDATGFRVEQRWTMADDGALACWSVISPYGGATNTLARIGYRFELPLDYANVSWFGRGPYENYRDRKSGAFHGRWSMDLTRFVMPYARPEDANNFEDTESVTLSGASGGMSFETLGKPFAFTALPYTPDEIRHTRHPAELPAPEKVVSGLYAATRGLGGSSCGPEPLARDVILTDRSYCLDFVLRPADCPPPARVVAGADAK